jgi:hypothetical protein
MGFAAFFSTRAKDEEADLFVLKPENLRFLRPAMYCTHHTNQKALT